MTVTGRFGVAHMPLPSISATAPASMSSCGAAMLLTVWRWPAESVRVMVAEEGSTVLVATSSSERPPEDSSVSRICMRS